jgi:hypothetical protein
VFDFNDPKWMSVEGLKDVLELAEMTVRIQENPEFVPGGDSKDPVRQGNSAVWDLPEWEFEYLIMEMARTRTTGGAGIRPRRSAPTATSTTLGTGVVAFSACVDGDGWTEMRPSPTSANPRRPAYFWDVLAEVAQVRLHDPASPGGQPIAEGDADVEFTLKNVQIPIDQAELLDAHPAATSPPTPPPSPTSPSCSTTTPTATPTFTTTARAADVDGDYLYFITEDDLRSDADGAPVRAYAYAHPGFYADAGLKQEALEDRRHRRRRHPREAQGQPRPGRLRRGRRRPRVQIAVGDKPTRSARHPRPSPASAEPSSWTPRSR